MIGVDDTSPIRLADAQVVVVRQLGALTRRVALSPIQVDQHSIRSYRAVVESAFAQRAVVPAPFGTVFPDREALVRWMELHYLTLTDTLRRVEDKQVARIRIGLGAATRSREVDPHGDRRAELEATAFDSFRVLRRSAIGFVPLQEVTSEEEDGAAEAAFLVDREQWEAFGGAVRDEQRRLPDLQFEQSGPFPPYDFVRLELHG